MPPPPPAAPILPLLALSLTTNRPPDVPGGLYLQDNRQARVLADETYGNGMCCLVECGKASEDADAAAVKTQCDWRRWI